MRRSRFGTSITGRVWRCERCGLEWLPPMQSDLQRFYESDEYRKSVDEASDTETFHRLHDPGSVRWLGMIDGRLLRGATVADVGCGAGSFLDGVRGYASKVVAIEPMRAYHQGLRDRGFHVHPYAAAAAAEWANRVDVACAFSVIEHVAQPVRFLEEIRALLRPDGALFVTTPNRDDILLRLDAPGFRSFFYRTHHTYYFDAASLRAAAVAAGFQVVELRSVHGYGFMNFVNWVRASGPTGDNAANPLGADFDRAWKAMLEGRGVGDYLWLQCTTL